MDFSKQSIVSRCFSKKTFGGLDEPEVRDCLNVLADEIERQRQIILMQEGKIREQQGFIEESRDREHIIKESIAVVQRVTDKIRKDAEEQSEVMLQNARNKKRALLKEARESMQSIYDDIAGLKRLYVQFKAGLTASVQAHLDLLKEDGAFSSALLESHDALPSSEEESEEDEEDSPSALESFSLTGDEGEGASRRPPHSFQAAGEPSFISEERPESENRPESRFSDEQPDRRHAAGDGAPSFSSLDKETVGGPAPRNRAFGEGATSAASGGGPHRRSASRYGPAELSRPQTEAAQSLSSPSAAGARPVADRIAADRITADRISADRTSADRIAEAGAATTGRITARRKQAQNTDIAPSEAAGTRGKAQNTDSGGPRRRAAQNINMARSDRITASRAQNMAGADRLTANRAQNQAEAESAASVRKESARSLSESLKSLTEDFL